MLNGRDRNEHTTEADFELDGVLIEVKSSMMTYHTSEDRWQVHFQGIKPDLHHRLWFVLLTPLAIIIWEWNNPSAAKEKQFYGSRGESESLAFKTIESKMDRCDGMTKLARVSISEDDFTKFHEFCQAKAKEAEAL